MPVEFSIKITQVNEEVLYTSDPITKVSFSDIEILKAKASGNRRRRVRLCAHSSINDSLHEMLIVHTKDAYVRPHKHPNKSESYHLIEGELQIVVFDDAGGVCEGIQIGPYGSGRTFFYRLSDSYFHMVIPVSDFVVFHETTNGPFRREDTVFAPWAPEDSDHTAVRNYMEHLAVKMGNLF